MLSGVFRRGISCADRYLRATIWYETQTDIAVSIRVCGGGRTLLPRVVNHHCIPYTFVESYLCIAVFPGRAINVFGCLRYFLCDTTLRHSLASYPTPAVFRVADRVHEAKSRGRRVGHTTGSLGPRRRPRPLLSCSTLPRSSAATRPRPQRHCRTMARQGGQGKAAGGVAPGVYAATKLRTMCGSLVDLLPSRLPPFIIHVSSLVSLSLRLTSYPSGYSTPTLIVLFSACVYIHKNFASSPPNTHTPSIVLLIAPFPVPKTRQHFAYAQI